jgi:hypothetical protein
MLTYFHFNLEFFLHFLRDIHHLILIIFTPEHLHNFYHNYARAPLPKACFSFARGDFKPITGIVLTFRMQVNLVLAIIKEEAGVYEKWQHEIMHVNAEQRCYLGSTKTTADQMCEPESQTPPHKSLHWGNHVPGAKC